MKRRNLSNEYAHTRIKDYIIFFHCNICNIRRLATCWMLICMGLHKAWYIHVSEIQCSYKKGWGSFMYSYRSALYNIPSNEVKVRNRVKTILYLHYKRKIQGCIDLHIHNLFWKDTQEADKIAVSYYQKQDWAVEFTRFSSVLFTRISPVSRKGLFHWRGTIHSVFVEEINE